MEKKSKAIQEVHDAFYKLAVAQRDVAWREIEEKDKLLAECSVVIEYYAKARGIYAMDGVWEFAEELLPKLPKGE